MNLKTIESYLQSKKDFKYKNAPTLIDISTIDMWYCFLTDEEKEIILFFKQYKDEL